MSPDDRHQIRAAGSSGAPDAPENQDEQENQEGQETQEGREQPDGRSSVFGALAVACGMYSVLPMPPVDFTPRNMRWALAWFPLVGVLSGGVLWGWSALAAALGLNAFVFGALAVALVLLVSGGIHLDGFCDAADAICSRRDAAEQLRIMKDPHVGPFALFITVMLLITQCAFYTQIYPAADRRLWLSVLLAMTLERCLSGFSVVVFPKARPNGLARLFSDPASRSVAVVQGICAAVCTAGIVVIARWIGAAVVLTQLIWFWQYRRFTKRRYGGITGDLAGLFLVVSEWLMLFWMAIGSGGYWHCFG